MTSAGLLQAASGVRATHMQAVSKDMLTKLKVGHDAQLVPPERVILAFCDATSSMVLHLCQGACLCWHLQRSCVNTAASLPDIVLRLEELSY